jgi:hypothetical protein
VGCKILGIISVLYIFWVVKFFFFIFLFLVFFFFSFFFFNIIVFIILNLEYVERDMEVKLGLSLFPCFGWCDCLLSYGMREYGFGFIYSSLEMLINCREDSAMSSMSQLSNNDLKK